MSLLKKTPLFCAVECSNFLDFLRSTRSRESQIAASLYFRKKLAACQEPPSELVEPIICELIDCLRRPSTELQLNAAWALTNLACGSRPETHRIIANGGVETLMQLASSMIGEVRDQAIWALGNLAADCSLCRERVRSVGLLGLLLMLLELPDYQTHEPRKILTWCLANLLRGGVNDLDLPSVNRLLTQLHSTITTHQSGSEEILCDAVWCIAYLIDHATVEGERVDILFAQPGLVSKIVELLKSDSIRALTGALRTVGNIITGTDEQTTAILDFDVLDDLSVLVNSNIHQISRECLWILSNVAAGTPEHITRLFSIDGLTESIFRLCSDQSPRKRKEAYWIMVNAMMGSPAPLYQHLLGGGLAQIIVQLMKENLDQALLERTFNTIRHSLQDRPQQKDYTIALFRRVGLVEEILKIARNPSTSANDSTSELANTILQQYFGIYVVRSMGNVSSKNTDEMKSKNKGTILVRIRRSEA